MYVYTSYMIYIACIFYGIVYIWSHNDAWPVMQVIIKVIVPCLIPEGKIVEQDQGTALRRSRDGESHESQRRDMEN